MDLKQVLNYIGIEAESLDDLKGEFEKTYVKRANAHKDEDIVKRTTGKTLDRVSAKIKASFQKRGMDVSWAEINSKPLEELVEENLDSYVETTGKTISELEEKVSKNGTEQLKAEQERYTKLEQKLKDRDKAFADLTAEHTKFKTESAGQMKNFRISYIREKEMANIPIRTDLKPKEREIMLSGFNAEFDKKYEIDFDEENKEFIKTKDKGERIQNKQKANEFMSIGEVMRMEAVEAGISPRTTHVVSPLKTLPLTQVTTVPAGGNGEQKRPMAPRR